MLHAVLILTANRETFLQLVKHAQFLFFCLFLPLKQFHNLTGTMALSSWDAEERVTAAASVTELALACWDTLLGSSSPFSSERMDVWLWSHQLWTSVATEEHPSSRVLGVPLIGDHVFVPDRLWNGVLLHGCVTPASHRSDWLVWSCGMFPSGPQ